MPDMVSMPSPFARLARPFRIFLSRTSIALFGLDAIVTCVGTYKLDGIMSISGRFKKRRSRGDLGCGFLLIISTFFQPVNVVLLVLFAFFVLS